MNKTDISSFDRTVQVTNEWLNELMDELEDVQRMLPKPVRQLWPRSASASA